MTMVVHVPCDGRGAPDGAVVWHWMGVTTFCHSPPPHRIGAHAPHHTHTHTHTHTQTPGRGAVTRGGGGEAPLLRGSSLPTIQTHERHRGGFGLWACLPDPKRALGAHGVPLIGEVRLRRTSLTPIPRGLGAGHTPPSAVVRVPVQVGGR